MTIKKVDRAIRLLQSLPTDKPIELAYSGGKDSDVILELARMAGIPFRPMYRSTTIDPPGTLSHVRDMGVEIVRPRMTFRQILEKKGPPSRYRRFCCSVLKEYAILDRCIMGIRAEESTKRRTLYHEPIACRVYERPHRVIDAVYPILDWSVEDVAWFIRDRSIQLAPVYYDASGYIDFSRRLGCLCCPLKSRAKRIAEFLRWPGMVRMYVRGSQVWLDSHPANNIRAWGVDACSLFVRTVFFDRNSDFIDASEGLYGTSDWKRFLESYFDIKL